MAYPKETKRAAQDAYHEARKFGHTKEEAAKIRDNWKNSKSTSDDQDDDDIYWTQTDQKYISYEQDCIDD